MAERKIQWTSFLAHSPKNTIVPFISRRGDFTLLVEFLVSHYILTKLIVKSQKVPNLIGFQNEMKSKFLKVVCRTLTCRAKSLLNLLNTPLRPNWNQIWLNSQVSALSRVKKRTSLVLIRNYQILYCILQNYPYFGPVWCLNSA